MDAPADTNHPEKCPRRVRKSNNRARLGVVTLDQINSLAWRTRMVFPTRPLLVALTLSAASCTAASLQAGSSAAKDPNVPGATGKVVVIGSNSSMAGAERVHPDWGSAALNSFAGPR
ncbi:MAG TPA: hypothetical protein VGF36_17700 [Rhodopila sp.]